MNIDLRLDGWSLTMINQLQDNTKLIKSDVIRYLVWIGIDLARHRGIEITTPWGTIRMFKNTNLKYSASRISLILPTDLTDKLEKCFTRMDIHTSLRECIHLGILSVYNGRIKLTGYFKSPVIMKFPPPTNKIAFAYYQLLHSKT